MHDHQCPSCGGFVACEEESCPYTALEDILCRECDEGFMDEDEDLYEYTYDEPPYEEEEG